MATASTITSTTHSSPKHSKFSFLKSVDLPVLFLSGGVFWAAAEPIAHFITEPPMYGDEALSPTQMAYNALAQSFMHWAS